MVKFLEDFMEHVDKEMDRQKNVEPSEKENDMYKNVNFATAASVLKENVCFESGRHKNML